MGQQPPGRDVFQPVDPETAKRIQRQISADAMAGRDPVGLATFTIGERFPLKGFWFRVVGAEGTRLILEGCGRCGVVKRKRQRS